MHFDGRAWSKQWLARHGALTAVSGRARDDVWIAGCDGAGFTAHWDGVRWTPHNITPVVEQTDPAFDICPLIAAESGGRALVAVRDRLFELGLAGGWEEATSPLAHADGAPLAGGQITALAARGDRPSGMWAVGTHSNGGAWTMDEDRNGIEKPTSSPFVVRRAGETWTKEALPEAMGGARAIWAPDADDVWVAGARGVIFHFDGHTWTREDSGTDEELVAIHGAGRSVWVLGIEGGLLHRRR